MTIPLPSMDKLRPYVWIALAASLYISYIFWQNDYPSSEPPPATPVTHTSTNQLPPLPGESSNSAPQSSVPIADSPVAAPQSALAQTINVHTDVLDLVISTQGGELDRAELVKYPLG